MDTIATGLISHRRLSKARKDRLILAMREAASNAVNYKAKTIEFIILKVNKDQTFLLCGHDGQPFGSPEEMADKGLAAYKSGEAGSSLNGVGLHASALSIAGTHWDRYAKLVIMSEIEGEWHTVVGEAETETRGRCWIKRSSSSPESKHMFSIFQKMTRDNSGRHPFFETNKVAYAFSLDKPTTAGKNSSEDSIRVELINTLIQSDPTIFSNISVRFFEGVIHPGESVGIKREEMSGGSSFRYAADPQEFDERYRDDTQWEKIQIDPFEIIINGEKVFVSKSSVQIRTYSGRKQSKVNAKNSKTSASWISTVRAGSTRYGRVNNYTRGVFSADSGSAAGKIPSKGIFLSISAISNENSKECFSRFDSSAVWMDTINAHSQDLFGMSLDNKSSYPDTDDISRPDATPFVLVNIDIEKISKIEYQDGEIINNPNSHIILGLFQEEPDFTVEPSIARQFAKYIIIEAKRKIPSDLLSLLKKRCPQPEPNFIPLWGMGSGQTINQPPKYPCTVFDISGPSFSVSNPKMNLGTRKHIAIYDPKSNGFINREINWKAGVTRGIQELFPTPFRSLSQQEQSNLRLLAEEKGIRPENIQALLLEIPYQVFKNTEHGFIDISDSLNEEYTHGSACVPTKNLICSAPNNPAITIGEIVEIPNSVNRNSNVKNKTITDLGSKGNKNNGTGVDSCDYITRHPQAIGRWVSSGSEIAQGGIFAPNSKNELINRLFLLNNAPPSLEQDIREFYFMMNAAIQTLQYSTNAMNIEGIVSDDVRYDENEEEIYDEHWSDYIINKQAESMLYSEICQRLFDKIEKHRGTQIEETNNIE